MIKFLAIMAIPVIAVFIAAAAFACCRAAGESDERSGSK